MATLVTIDKCHLETLMRRAECHSNPSVIDIPANLQTVTIPKSKHDDMLRKCREYDNLKQALLQGGIPQASLEMLIQGPDVTQPNNSTGGNHDGYCAVPNGGTDSTPYVKHDITRAPAQTPHHDAATGNTSQQEKRGTPFINGSDRHGVETEDASFHSDGKGHSPDPIDGRDSSTQQASSGENHTVALKNLPERATHRDIVGSIRGGALVDVFLRSRERMASVTFADATAASDFLAYAKGRNVYILGKLIDATWSERQFYFPPYMASQLVNGASRNLVIRGVHPNLTETRIRADLDHIHNLVVISVTYAQGNAYIYTNSIQKASFARTCMKSRVPYNTMRIEYFPDECAQPLPKVPSVSRRAPLEPAKKLNPMANRFQMLNIDEPDDDSDEQEDMTSCASPAGGVCWMNHTIAV